MSMKNSIRPLVDRPTNWMERRTARLVTRSARHNAITRGWVMGVVDVMRRGFFGRMRWLLRGV